MILIDQQMSVIVGCIIWILYTIAAGKKDGMKLVMNFVICNPVGSYKCYMNYMIYQCFLRSQSP